ncbi:MAG: alanine racemase [Cyanobacteria bacterium WB6_1B_304]|nr:alanine racemase [Cyanobacteria bacterium WB6_1B_304]
MVNRENKQILPSLYQERAWVEISRTALTSNVRYLLGRLSPGTEMMTVVKADAYGHGAVTVARTVLAAGAHWLGVATVPEGIELRENGISAPILVLGAVNAADEMRAIAHWQLQPTLTNPHQAMGAAQELGNSEHPYPVHLKIDTGMSRLGVGWESAVSFVQQVQELPNLVIASIYSHFATADDPDPMFMYQQHERFITVVNQLQQNGDGQLCLHIANSAATLRDSTLHHHRVRIGLATYGLYPSSHVQDQFKENRLCPVMQIKARITQVKLVGTGTGVSYGHQFVTQRPTSLAIVGIGYADGVPRNLSNKMMVLLRGEWVRQVGAITMDMLMIDVTDLPEVQPGEVVTVLGTDGSNHISAHDWAMLLGTIPWEILCGFKHRLPRINMD